MQMRLRTDGLSDLKDKFTQKFKFSHDPVTPVATDSRVKRRRNISGASQQSSVQRRPEQLK